jgi:hypothetical protein
VTAAYQWFKPTQEGKFIKAEKRCKVDVDVRTVATRNQASAVSIAAVGVAINLPQAYVLWNVLNFQASVVTAALKFSIFCRKVAGRFSGSLPFLQGKLPPTPCSAVMS